MWVTKIGLMIVNSLKIAAAAVTLAAVVAVNIVGVVVIHTLHAVYKVVYGLGLLIALPSIAINGGKESVAAAFKAYGKMWTPAHWRATDASQVWGTKTPSDFAGANVYDFSAFKAAKSA